MRRMYPAAVLAALIAVVVAAWVWRWRPARMSRNAPLEQTSPSFLPVSLPARSSGAATLKGTMQELTTNAVEFARSRMSGAIGVALSQDPKTGLPVIEFVTAGSPADQAGLRAGDTITRVDGLGTTGKRLAQVVESMRGPGSGVVTLSLQRGSTNYERAIHRISWHALRQL